MGLLRPATPLSVILFAAFVLLLLSTLSTPVIQSVPLATYQGWNFGVFGYCKGSTCSGYKVGYSTDGLFEGGNASGDFELPSSARHSLSGILIVHPVATFMVLVCFALACAAHFHSPSHSPRYLLALLILTIPTLLVTLLAFLVDILLFVPHMNWGGWIVLGATILIIASSVLTCAMRRTLVSRKARKKRIAENADMNGTNYYENRLQTRMMADELPKADSPPPMMNGSIAEDKQMPQYAAFEMKRQDTRSQDGHHDNAMMTAGAESMDDQAPLNPRRDPSIRSASTGGGSRIPYAPPSEGAPPMPMGRPSVDSNGMGQQRRPSRDQYGNPIPPGIAMGMASDLPPPGLRHQSSQGSLGSDRSGGYPPRGRGYGPPPGRGYGPPRGGYGPPRGGFGPRGGFRGQPPPPGWRGGRGGYGPPPGMMGRGGMPRQGPPPGYTGAIDPYYAPMPRSAPSPTMNQPSAPEQDEFVAGPIGQAIEMDERTGSPPVQTQQPAMNPSYGLRDSDGDVAGMVDLQQGRNSPMRHPVTQSSGPMSPTSMYSEQPYMPPRTQWLRQNPPIETPHSSNSYSPVPHDSISSRGLPSSNVMASTDPALPSISDTSPPMSPPMSHKRNGSEAYYEDVDPRFAVDPPSEVGASADQAGPLPSALTPGGYAAYGGGNRMAPSPLSPPNHDLLHAPASTHIPSYVSSTTDQADHSTRNLSEQGDHSEENLPEGARSPGAGSEASHFTSVSQRGINPNWRPGPGSAYGGAASSASAAQRRREDVILNGNPDFSLPGMRPPGRNGLTRGGPPPPTAMGLTPGGRYPTDI